MQRYAISKLTTPNRGAPQSHCEVALVDKEEERSGINLKSLKVVENLFPREVLKQLPRDL